MEQSASAAYPNVLVADYLGKAGRASKGQLKAAEALVREGYQKILTFQSADGGFGWWSGGANPQLWVTAYGLNLLRETARIVDIDRRPEGRARAWLLKRQSPDGSWESPGATHGAAPDRVALTAYVTWALGGNERAARWLEGHLEGGDSYRQALVTLALAASGHHASARRAATQLAGMEWTSRGTLSYGRGSAGRVETTGLAVQALMVAGVAPGAAAKGIEYLVQARREGDWGSTQATIQALRALTAASAGGQTRAKVKIVFRSGPNAREMEVVLGGGSVPSVDLTDFLGAETLEVDAPSEVALNLQLVTRHFEPWAREEAPLGLDLQVPERWTVGRPTRIAATVRGVGARMVVAEIGLAPGATPAAGSLEKLMAERKIARYETRLDRVVFYLASVEGDTRLDFDVVPRLAAEARVRPSLAYEFYDPDRLAAAPSTFVTISP